MPKNKGEENLMVGVVYCGGKGSRMQPVTTIMRKEMLPLGSDRKPILEHIVSNLKRCGIRKIYLLGSENNRGDVFWYFGSGDRFGVEIVHLADPVQCKGTGHALLCAIKSQRLAGHDLLIHYGDVYHQIDMKKLRQDHAKNIHRPNIAATVVVTKNYIMPKGVAMVDRGKITSFVEKPNYSGKGSIAVGVLCLNVDRLVAECKISLSPSALKKPAAFRDLMGNIVGTLAKRDSVAAFETNSYWKDIGSFQDYLDVQKNFDNQNSPMQIKKPKKKSGRKSSDPKKASKRHRRNSIDTSTVVKP